MVDFDGAVIEGLMSKAIWVMWKFTATFATPATFVALSAP